jgi:preprotein translocase subunit YajC
MLEIKPLLFALAVVIVPFLIFVFWEYRKINKQRAYHKARLEEIHKLGQQAVEEARRAKTNE